MKFGQRLKCLRDKNKVTQDELAKHLGVGRPTIAGYETKGKQPSFEILEKMADFFSVSTDYLLGRTDIKQPIQNTSKDKLSSDEISEEIRNLSPESQEELKKLIELYKLRDMQKRNTELSDELTSTE
ncbi:helix-turn-helix domain-containing protein [Proteiniborus sp. MB09-C3]|uniref:helix-turn-helix domain-containing protein n=1 Tax=Proteiniborus sp. MB09-C3 TaxID=3050072 RepID=UPI00255273C8|nr:helix-turn-helix domain-containing protein [Proteiniborus sp. MB09-C3]WIV11080.1 helix-turn-helix domain-containing protein [Proteiniborus sp. MB09-C3]